jgi:myo-inositol-1(or 4)-monophosphatase
MEPTIDLDELHGWAREGGELARSYFRRTTARRKADRSVVTEADLEVERLLVERLSARYPSYGIIGEENARQDLDRELIWAIDPIDGTAAFVAGLPFWGISIGLLQGNTPVLGVFYMPIPDELYWSVPGQGAFCNGTPLHVAGARAWDGEDWLAIPSNSHRRFSIDFPGKTRSLGSSVANLCYVARGSALGVLLTRCAIWDLVAGLAILFAAGGAYTGLSGQAPDLAAMVATGAILPEPVVAAGPAHLEMLRTGITPRR